MTQTQNTLLTAEQNDDIISARLAECLPQYLDNCRLGDTAMSESEDDMKQYRERVQIGTDSNGKPICRWATGHSKQELHANIARLLNESGQIETPPPPKIEGPMFNDYVRDWYEKIRSKRTPGRIAEEKGMLKNYIYPFFEGKRLAEIKSRDIEMYFAQGAIQALATETAKKHGQMLHRVFKLAFADGEISRNPAEDYKPLLPKRANPREALTLKDANDVIAHLHELSNEDRLLMSLFMFTGMRRGEALGLQVKHINPLLHEVDIRQSVHYTGNKPTLGTPKTKNSVRRISILNGFPYELIAKMEPEDYVLGGASPWTETKYRRAWERIGKTIDLHGATAHVLRHTFATLAIAAGWDVKTVQGTLGHATPDMTLRVYAHLQKEKIAQAGKQMPDIYKAM